jgi:hypothetical protein
MQMAGIAPGHFCYCGGESPEVVPRDDGESALQPLSLSSLRMSEPSPTDSKPVCA